MKPSILLFAVLVASSQWPAWAQQPATTSARNAQSQSARWPPACWTTGWQLNGACSHKNGHATAS